ncbi:MAG TPA: CHASE domain-containing protein [Bryobacteraceae bacterium]|nr:CHASE domain-containing protein [Bryobacteraceae bacterium]
MSSTTTITRRQNPVAIIAGGLSVLIGAAVLAGYFSGHASLVTLFPGSAPMRFATAIAIVCAGSAVLLLAAGYRRSCASAAAIGGIVALADLIASAAGAGITGLEPVGVANPALPFAGTLAGCLLIIGSAALILMSGVVRLHSRLAVVGAAGSVLSSVGIVAIISYLAGVSSAFTAGAFSQLGIHTAIAVAALGAALIRFAWRDTLATTTGTPAWLPVLVGAATLATVFCLYGAIIADQESDFSHQVTFEAEGLRQFVSTGLENRIQPLLRLARQRAVTPDMKKEEWDTDVQMIMIRGGYQAIEWVDTAGRVVWTAPPGAGDSTPDGNAAFEARRRAAFDTARRNRAIAAARPIDLVTGGKGTIVVVPVFVRDELAGYVAGVFRYQLLFQSLLSSNPSPQYSIAVYDGKESLFTQGSANSSARLTRTTDLVVGGGKWTLRIAPTEALVVQSRSPVGGALLVIGVFLALFFSLLVRVAQRTGARAPFDAVPGIQTASTASYSDPMHLPVVSYGPDGAALAWNDGAARLLAGEPPRIAACDSGFRTITVTLLRAIGSPENLDALRSLLESCTSCALVFDAEGRYVAANSAAHRTLGWSDANWSGRSIGAAVPATHEALDIQNVLLMQGQWSVPAAGRAAAASAS